MCSDPEDPTPTCDGSAMNETKVGDRIIRGEGIVPAIPILLSGSEDPIEQKLESLIKEEIARRVDPYKGWLPIGVPYEGSIYEELDNYALEAYYEAGIDIYQLATNLLNNPTDEEFWLNSEVPIEYLYAKGLVKKAPGAIYILAYFGLDTSYFANYESNYLNALIVTHPASVDRIMDRYNQNLLDTYGSTIYALEFLQLSFKLAGTQ
jgi:hypothetical protein